MYYRCIQEHRADRAYRCISIQVYRAYRAYRCIQEHRANRAYRCISIQVYRANRAYRCIQEHRAYRCITDVFKNTELTELTDALVFKNTELTELTDVLVFKNAELTDDNRAYRCCCCTPLSRKSWNINRACPFCNG